MLGHAIRLIGFGVWLSAAGCYYTGFVSVVNSNSAPELGQSELAAATRAVEEAIEPFGYRMDPRSESISRDSRESPAIDNVVLGVFLPPDWRTPGRWVEVRAVIAKKSREFTVMVLAYRSLGPTKLTEQVEQAIARRLRQEFPDREVRVSTEPSPGP